VLALVFDRLKDPGLVVREDKCHFCKPEMKYLGYLVDSHGLRPDPEKDSVPPGWSNSTDKWYQLMIHRLEEHPEKYSCWRIEDSLLYKLIGSGHPEFPNCTNRWKLVVPKDHRKYNLHRCHDLPTSGRLGIYKTFMRIAERYYWPQIRSDVIIYVRRCEVCAQSKVEQKPPAGPLPRSKQGNTHILVVADYFSKYVVLFACRSANSKALVKFVEQGIFLVYGAPQHLTCDNCTPMKSKEFQSLCARYKVNLFYTASYYPRADHTERTNREIKTMFKSYVQQDNHRSWEDNLSAIGCAIRTARHEEFRRPILNRNIMFRVGSRVIGRCMSELVGGLHQPASVGNIGIDTICGGVLLRMLLAKSAKLPPEYVGPFIIGKRTGTCTYELQDESGVSKGVWHVQDLKPMHSGRFSSDADVVS
ncbi:hypothetical protein HUJ04_005001, partial [Dendroctonus ponderosae]